jgi:hypothetical protein
LKPRIILINVLLVAAIGASLWQGRARWNEAQTKRHSALEAKIPGVGPPPMVSAPRPVAPPAAKYVDVATNDLFSKDRNPTVVIEAPKLEKVREMPALPVVYGVLGLPSGVKALMAERVGAGSKSVHAGDSIGEFKIIALDAQSVTFTWEDKEVHKQIDDLMDRSGRNAPAGPAPLPNVAAAPANNMQPGVPQFQQPQQPNNPPPPPNASGTAAMGGEIGAPGHSERACRQGDNTPAGTVVDGYKKVLVSTPFGTNCRWTPAQ